MVWSLFLVLYSRWCQRLVYWSWLGSTIVPPLSTGLIIIWWLDFRDYPLGGTETGHPCITSTANCGLWVTCGSFTVNVQLAEAASPILHLPDWGDGGGQDLCLAAGRAESQGFNQSVAETLGPGRHLLWGCRLLYAAWRVSKFSHPWGNACLRISQLIFFFPEAIDVMI